MVEAFEPKIIAFLCNWCAYEGADSAGRARLDCPAGVLAVRLMCSGRVEPEFILAAFGAGADGVLVLGCPSGDCHYRNGNLQALKRMALLKNVLRQYGVAEERLVLDWVGAGEGQKYAGIVQNMVRTLKQMGPL